MTIHLWKIPIRIHGVLPLLCIFAWISGIGASLLPSLFAFLLHETGHLLAAKFRRLKIDEIEFTPYGGVISVANLEAAPPLSRFILAAAGPLFSLLGCFFSPFLLNSGLASFAFWQRFFKSNLLLFFINLLPVLPLDGGRMVRAALSRAISFSAATRILLKVGYFIGGALIALSFFYAFRGILFFSPAFAGAYLIYAAALEGKQSMMRYTTALIGRRQKLQDMECLEIREIAASGQMPLQRLLSHFQTGKIHRIYVFSDDGMKEQAVIQEQEFVDALLSRECETLHDLIKKRQAL